MYFANGTEGEIFRNEYCDKCKRSEECPIWDAHMFYNYEQMENQSLKGCLTLLIDKDGCHFYEENNEA